jgi:hypothetical protein
MLVLVLAMPIMILIGAIITTMPCLSMPIITMIVITMIDMSVAMIRTAVAAPARPQWPTYVASYLRLARRDLPTGTRGTSVAVMSNPKPVLAAGTNDAARDSSGRSYFDADDRGKATCDSDIVRVGDCSPQ